MQENIQARYTQEASACSNLSCGNNMDILQISRGEAILDLGCGRGTDTLEAARRTGQTGFAVGLDLTQAMVETAARNAAEGCISNVRFVCGDIESLPFDEGTFDAVISNCVINHARDKTKVYKEIYRVLKPGGRFVVSDAVTKTPLPDTVKNDPEAWAQCFGGAVTEQEYFDSIHLAGFGRTEVKKRREYKKNTYDFISLTIQAFKINPLSAKGGIS